MSFTLPPAENAFPFPVRTNTETARDRLIPGADSKQIVKDPRSGKRVPDVVAVERQERGAAPDLQGAIRHGSADQGALDGPWSDIPDSERAGAPYTYRCRAHGLDQGRRPACFGRPPGCSSRRESIPARRAPQARLHKHRLWTGWSCCERVVGCRSARPPGGNRRHNVLTTKEERIRLAERVLQDGSQEAGGGLLE